MASRIYPVRYPTGDAQLNLTADRSGLKTEEVSVCLGRDVLKPGRLAKAPGRRPLIIAPADHIPVADLDGSSTGHALTTVIPSDFHGYWTHVSNFHSGAKGGVSSVAEVSHTAWWEYLRVTYQKDQADDKLKLVLSLNPAGQAMWGNFTSEMIGGYMQITSPAAYIRPKYITFQDQGVQNDGALWQHVYFDINEWPFVMDFFAPGTPVQIDGFGCSIYCTTFHDKRGFWVSNGQKFWLFSGGKYTLYMDLGADSDTLGVAWRGTQISPTVFMFTAGGQPPRIIRLGDPPITGTVDEVEDSRHWAGVLPPAASYTQEQPAMMWKLDEIDASGGRTSPYLSSSLTGISASGMTNSFRLKCRVVDEATGATSAFVDCYPVAKLQLGADSLYWPIWVLDHKDPVYTVPGPAASPWGFIVQAVNNTGVAYLDGSDKWVIPDNSEGDIPFKTGRATKIEFWRSTNGGVYFFHEMTLSVAWAKDGFLFDVEGHPVFPSNAAGRPTEVDLAYSTRLTPAIFNQSPLANGGYWTSLHAFLGMSDDELQHRPQLTAALSESGGLPPMCREVATINGLTICAGVDETTPEFVTIQGKNARWPRLQNNEEIAYSEIREGLLMPESFFWGSSSRLAAVRRLSRSGDKIQRLVTAGDVIVAVMCRGVHRIVRDGDEVVNTQIAAVGAGTPWPETVLSIGDIAVWASGTGLRFYDPLDNDGEGKLSLVPFGGMTEWFTEALRDGMRVEAGFDARHGTIHFRRHEWANTSAGGVHTYRVAGTNAKSLFLEGAAVYNLSTGAWSLIDDDTGFAYVSATHAEATPLDAPALYSVDYQGCVWEENYEGESHPYDALRLSGAQGDDGIVIDRDTIKIPGLFPGGKLFGTSMAGEVVRFYDPTDPNIHELARRIDRSGLTAQCLNISYSRLPVIPKAGAKFVIAAIRFAVRFRAELGTVPANVKTLEALEVVARPGKRHEGNPAWSDPPTGLLNIRGYRDCGDTPAAQATDEIKVFDDDDLAPISADRHTSIEIQGNAIEIEIENHDPQCDFTIAAVTATYREEGDQVADVSTAV